MTVLVIKVSYDLNAKVIYPGTAQGGLLQVINIVVCRDLKQKIGSMQVPVKGSADRRHLTRTNCQLLSISLCTMNNKD
jgi:hypothetical protein